MRGVRVLALGALVLGGAPSAQPAPRLAVAPTHGTVTLQPGFAPDPQTATGTAGGTLDASGWDASCAGFVDPVPDHALVLRGAEPWLRMYVTSAIDTTLVVRRPDGTWACNDDTFGRHPAVDGAFPAGRYLIWVGSYHAGTTAPHTLAFTELRSGRP